MESFIRSPFLCVKSGICYNFLKKNFYKRGECYGACSKNAGAFARIES